MEIKGEWKNGRQERKEELLESIQQEPIRVDTNSGWMDNFIKLCMVGMRNYRVNKSHKVNKPFIINSLIVIYTFL